MIIAQTDIPMIPQSSNFNQIQLNSNNNTFNVNTQFSQHNLNSFPMGATAQDIMENQYRMAEIQMGVYIQRHYLTPEQNLIAQQEFFRRKIENDNYKSLQKQKQHEEIIKILKEEEKLKNAINHNYKSQEFLNAIQKYDEAYNTLNNMLTGKTQLSVSKAYFTIENAFGNTYLTEKEFNDMIYKSSIFIKQWLHENNMDITKSENLHYGIQKFMRDTLTIHIKNIENNTTYKTYHTPFTYDYIDFKAENDFNNYFVTKCLATGAGQCNSLPAAYLIIAEKLGVEAFLTFAPQHSFIKYRDSKGKMHAYEPTSNWKISDQWYIDNMGILPQAIQNGLYLQPLNKEQIIANCMIDLAYGYLRKFGVQDGSFILESVQTALNFYPQDNNITAYFLISSVLSHNLNNAIRTNNLKTLNEVQNHPKTKEIYDMLIVNESKIKSLGFQSMPEDIYLKLMQYHEFRGEKQEKEIKQIRNQFITQK